MKNFEIVDVVARQVLDSRGNPTVECEVFLSNNISASAIVPSGASTGIYEANEKRDGDKSIYVGKSVLDAVNNVNTVIKEKLIGMNVLNQSEIDYMMIDLDGTQNKSSLGANAILATSLAVMNAAAKALNLPLYKYIGGINGKTLPTPMMNIINGGAHANNNLNIQEFMITPVNFKTFSEALRCGTEIFHTLAKVLKEKNLFTGVGDEGGYAPNLQSDKEALDLIVTSIEKAGYKPFEDVFIALDVAASEWYEDGVYVIPSDSSKKTADELIQYYEELVNEYKIISIEDPLNEEDYEDFAKLRQKLLGKCQIVGDDLYATNKTRLLKGIETNATNSILIKLNQIGTVTETLEVIELAKSSGLSAIISHRSGETEDTTIADLAVAVNSGLIKTGAPSRTDRVSKYNRLLRIESDLCGFSPCNYKNLDDKQLKMYQERASYKGKKSYNLK